MKRFKTHMVILLVLSMFAFEFGPVSTSASEPEAGKELIVCLKQEPSTLFLLEAEVRGDTAAQQILNAIYDPGVDWVDYTPLPMILRKLPSLENGDVQIKEEIIHPGDTVYNPVTEAFEQWGGGDKQMRFMTVTFCLEQEVLWEDGKKVTALDSVFAFELDRRQTDHYRRRVEMTRSYEAIDDFTVKWTGRPGYVNVGREYLSFFWIPLPLHKLEGKTYQDIVKSDYTLHPIGYGPFCLKEWVRGDRIVLERNPYYWLRDAGLPYLDRIVFIFISEPQSALAALEAEECDLIPPGNLSLTQVPYLKDLEEQGQIRPIFVRLPMWEHLDFGIRCSGGTMNPLDKPMVRQAIAYGTNRGQMAELVFHGLTGVMQTYRPPEVPLLVGDLEELGYKDDVDDFYPFPEYGLEDYEYNPEKAYKLLKEAGYPDGFNITYIASTSVSVADRAIAEIFQQNMADIGISVDLQFLAWPAFIESLRNGHFDVAKYAWPIDSSEPLCNLYHSDNIPGDGNNWRGNNFSGFSNSEFNLACKEALSAIDPMTRFEKHALAQSIFNRDLPSLPLFRQVGVGAARTEVLGYVENVMGRKWALSDIRSLDLDPPEGGLDGQQNDWIVLILDEFEIINTDESCDEAMVITYVSDTRTRRSIGQHWPETMWHEASAGKQIKPDLPIYWIRVGDLKDDCLNVMISVLDNDDGPKWIEKTLGITAKIFVAVANLFSKINLGEKIQEVVKLKDVKLKDVKLKDVKLKDVLVLEKIKDEMGGNELEGTLAVRINVKRALAAGKVSAGGVKYYTYTPRGVDSNENLHLKFTLYRVPAQTSNTQPKITIAAMKFGDPGNGDSGNIYVNSRLFTKAAGAQFANTAYQRWPDKLSYKDVDNKTTYTPQVTLETPMLGEDFPFVYFEVGIWDDDDFSNDDMIGLYSKTLCYWKWRADVNAIHGKFIKLKGIDEGSVNVKLMVCKSEVSEQEPNDNMRTARALGSVPGEVCGTGAIQSEGDCDWWQFAITGTANVDVFIETFGKSGDTVIALYDSKGRQIHKNDNDGTAFFSYISWNLVPGRYYVKVWECGNNQTIRQYILAVRG